jgi:hypothetical protein
MSLSLENLHEMWTNDSKYKDDLDVESLRVANLHSKYVTHLSEIRSRRRAFELERRKTFAKLRDYYSGAATEDTLREIGREQYRGPKVLKSEIEEVILLDKEMISLDSKIESYREREEYLSDVMRHINIRGYQIKNAIDWRRFTGGS